MSMKPNVHGYSSREFARLADQANVLSELLHQDTSYPAGSLVLECGCGTGAQTAFLASRNAATHIVSVDVSAAALKQARLRVEAAGHRNVGFLQADLFELPFAEGHSAPVQALAQVRYLSRPTPSGLPCALGR